MRKTNYTILALACMSAVFACARIEEPDVETAPEKVRMTFAATIDAGETKTVLEGSLDDEVMHTWWMPSDEIGIVPAGGSNAVVERFVNSNEENSDNGSFEGNISMSDRYYAVYPSGSTYRTGDMNMFLIDLPQTQPYVEGSFAQDIAPMVASAGYGEILHFKNLCGLLALRLKGEESIRSISFSGKSADGNLKYVSGMHYVPMTETGSDYTLLPATGFTADGFKTYNHVTLVCDEPVALSADEATPFYFVIPPGTYDTFTVMITTADGKVMMKEGKTPLTIEKAHVKPTAALEYAETVTIDLSSKGTANSYIVSEPGLYTFDADVMGNGEFGIIQGAGFHTDHPYFTPASAELLWEDNPGMTAGISLADNKITFLATGVEGNALIAAKDSEGTILWSWHIWVTDHAEHIYNSTAGAFTVLDRNLGATSAEAGLEAAGLHYQWGRKDPFKADVMYYTTAGQFTEISESVTSPQVFATSDENWYAGSNNSLWSRTKTIYDPCPVGWRVADTDIWNGISIKSDIDGNFGGVMLGFNDSDMFWFQDTPTINHDSGGISGSTQDDNTEFWTTTSGRSQYINYSSLWLENRSNAYGFPVRCMKQDDFAPVSLSVGRAEDVTSTSAHIEGVLAVADKSLTVEERGFVHGTTAGVTIETGTQTETGNSTGSFSADLTSLTPLTRYYVRAYAVMTDGSTYYSNAVSFVTPGDDGVTDLSVGGTANSYMVYPVHGIYTFDLVKGNSTASVGNVTTVEVLWETLNTTDAVSIGDVIESAELSGTKAKFTVPEDAVPGNALIVAKNSGGRILWSWHIWVVDLDPDATGQIYPSGAMLMDRNLGALVNDVDDVRSFGLFYQWGRKDPFVGYGGPDYTFAVMTVTKNYVGSGSDTNTMSYSVLHPDTVISYSDWNKSDDYWDPYKTIYDPCPAGWRVADNDAWAEFNNAYEYPKAGYTWSTEGVNYVNSYYYVWSAERSENYVCYFHNGGINTTWDAYNEHNVRCMKDADFIMTTGTTTSIADVSAVVSGTLEVRDNTVMDIKGLVCSSTDGSPKLYTDNVIITEEDGTAGTFTSRLTGLKPNTTYYVRAYASGGYNTRYGEVISFKTISGGSGEGFDDGGDYEWE